MKFARKLAVSLFFVLCSCASYRQDPKIETIVAPLVEDKQISFSKNDQNAGVIDFIEGKGLLIDEGAKKRYDSLVSLYGKDVIPPVNVGDGITATNENFLLDLEHLVIWMELNDKFKNRTK